MKYLFTIVSFLIPLTIFAQVDSPVGHKISVLEEEIRQAETDSIKFEKYLELSFQWSYIDSAKAELQLDKARKLAGTTPSNYQKGLLHYFKASILFDYNLENAKIEYMKAEKLLSPYRFTRAYYYLAKIWNSYGAIIQRQDNNALFLNIIQNKTIPYARLAKDSLQVGVQLYNMGLVFSNIDEHEKADQYFQASSHALSNQKESVDQKLALYTLAGKNQLENKNDSQARNYLDSAAHYANKAPNSLYQAEYHTTEGKYYRHQRDRKRSLFHLNKALSFAEILRDPYDLSQAQFELFYLYREFGEYEEAKKQLLKHAEMKFVFRSMRNRAIHHREMANLDFHLKNYREAYQHMQTYAVTKDSLYDSKRKQDLLELEQKFQLTERENEILKLQTTNQEQKLTILSTQWWKGASLVVLLFAACIAYFSWRLFLNKQKTLEQNRKLLEEELKSIRQEERMKQYDSVLQGQELERNRLARDLHDGLGGLLAGVKLKLSSIISKNKNSSEISQVTDQLDYAINELRRISRNMMPESLLYMGLTHALEDLCKYMNSTKTAVKYQQFELQSHLDKPTLTSVYRIVQELLANAIKHAHAQEVILQCSELEGWLFITVEDNGIGMDLTLKQHAGLGLKNIHNRVKLLNGNIEIISQKGEGYTINIQIPLK